MSTSVGSTVSWYNFTGATINNVLLGGQSTTNGIQMTSPIILSPNTPSTPKTSSINNGSSYSLTYVMLKYLDQSTSNPYYASVPFPNVAGKVSVYFVNDNAIDYTKLVPLGGDITQYTYSSGYQKATALIAYKDRYALATSYNFGSSAIVIAVPANPTITTLTKVDTIDWTKETVDSGKKDDPEKDSSNWVIILIAIIIILIVIAVAIGIAYKVLTKNKDVATGAPEMDALVTWQAPA